MEKLYKIYAVTSILCLVVLVASPLKDSVSKWRRNIKKYNEILDHLPEEEKPVPTELQQIWVPGLDRIDRCTTCHLGMTNDKLKHVPLPFRTHPRMYHDIEAFGCTICHEGQGLATEYGDVHLPSESWDQSVLPNHYLESTCGRCHIDEDLKETPVLNRGSILVRDFKCFGCHDQPGEWSTFTPPHDGIGSKVSGRDWIVRWLRNPKSIRPKTKMPNFSLSEDDVNTLADFLMHFKTFPEDTRLESLPAVYLRNRNDENFITSGRTLFREAPCISCHELEGLGGDIAADLAKVGSKAKEIWVYNFLKNPQQLQPGVEMPQFGYSTEELASITAYFSSECIDWDVADEESGHDSPSAFLELGRPLYYRYNCRGCHQLSGLTIDQNRGPDHMSMGSKEIYQIWFGETEVPHTLYDYIDAKLKSPRIFGETMRMPNFGLSDEDRLAMTTYLLSLRNENLPPEFIRRGDVPTPFNPQGIMGDIIRKFSCVKCHSFGGEGGTIAPDLSYVGSRLLRNWLRQFFEKPVSRRPLIEERMPDLSLTDDEIETLLDYFYTVLLDDSLSVPRGWTPSREARDRGNRLFWEIYGCQSCHVVSGRGGYLGPPLDDVGDRLQSGWMTHWLLDPQKYIPDTIEPRTGMSMEEALDVVAYLLTL